MKERPVLFSAPMVRAILEGRKTQTRRVVKPQPPENTISMYAEENDDFSAKTDRWYTEYLNDGRRWTDGVSHRCPYGQPGDRLWVRENAYYWGRWIVDGVTKKGRQSWKSEIEQGTLVMYCVGDHRPTSVLKKGDRGNGWIFRPGMFMPRWASRIDLEKTGIRVERLNNISEQDAKAEGARWHDLGKDRYYQPRPGWSMEDPHPADQDKCLHSAIAAFGNFINRLHGGKNWNLKPDNLWEQNPWVWVIEFKRVKP